MTSSPRTDIEAAVIRTLTWRLVPFLFLLYIVAYLDRINVGFAALQMQRQLGLSDAAYGLGAGMFFLAEAAAAAGIAVINSFGNLGGFAGPYIIGLVRSTTGEFKGGLLLVSSALAVSGVLVLLVRMPRAARPAAAVRSQFTELQ